MTKTRRQIQADLKLVDLVAEIIDARIPISSRNPDIDELVGEKPRLIVLNRADQADPAMNRVWTDWFRRQGWAVLETNARDGKGVGQFSTVIRQALKEKLEQWKAKGLVGRPVRAMVVGVPNVGKSTFINQVAKRKSAKAGNRPGVTRGKQWVSVDAGLELLDTPGILWPKFEDQSVGLNLAYTGAVKDENPTSMVFDRGIMRPDQLPGAPFDMDFGYFHMATQPFLKVDIEGERITNESSPYDFLIHALARKSSQRAWFDIWDSNWPTDIERFHTIGCSGLIKGEGTNQMDPEGVEGTAAIIDALVEEGKIVKADTLEEIADAFGINKETFLATVEQYNGFYDAQNDTQYGKEPFRLSEIRTAPFYACKLSGMALATLDGIKINTKFQALDENNAPIEGLYVIGNDSGNYYNGTYPNLAAGLNAGRCVTFGMLCGRQVANL